MAGKDPNTKYGEFRVFAEWRPQGRTRIKRELVPGMCAWLLMLGRRYEAQARGAEHSFITKGVPGGAEYAKRMRQCVEHIQWMLDLLPHSFSSGEWREAVAEVCNLLKIEPTSGVIMDIPDGELTALLPVPTDASHESGSGEALQPGVAPGAERPDGGRKKVSRRTGRAGKSNLPGRAGDQSD